MKQRLSTTSYVLIAIMILSAGLRLLHLGTESLWLDEIISVAIARLDWTTFWKVISHFEANMVLYYCLLRFWIKFGENEVMLRSLSVAAGCFTVLAIYAIGAHIFGRKVALISALLLAVNAFHIKFSQEARSYSLVVLLVLLCCFFFVKAIERNSLADWAGYIVTGTLAAYSHFLSVLIVVALLVSLVFLPSKEVPWKRLLLSTSVMVLLLTPLGVFVLTRNHGQLGSVPKLRFSEVYGIFYSFVGEGKLLFLVYLALCLIAAAQGAGAWSRFNKSQAAWHYGVIISWLFVPIGIGFTISFFQPLLVARYFIICLPALVILAALGISSLHSRPIAVGSLGVVLVLSGQTVVSYYSHLEKENWREATTYVVSQASQKDGICFYIDTGRLGFDYYLRRLGRAGQTWNIVFPQSLGWEQELTTEKADNALFLSLAKRYDRIWLFLSHDEANPIRRRTSGQIETWLADTYPAVTETTFKGVHVRLYSKNSKAQ